MLDVDVFCICSLSLSLYSSICSIYVWQWIYCSNATLSSEYIHYIYIYICIRYKYIYIYIRIVNWLTNDWLYSCLWTWLDFRALNCWSSPVGRSNTSVSVRLRVKHHNLHIVSACNCMVNTTIANIVCPSITAKHPHGRLSEPYHYDSPRENLQIKHMSLDCISTKLIGLGWTHSSFPLNNSCLQLENMSLRRTSSAISSARG